ncbi:MAG: GH116 family glycosyl hydrolase [Armatimonadota bacterium]|nr:GH116 family glycosyl hydrolase [Armatimonadota bacterium]
MKSIVGGISTALVVALIQTLATISPIEATSSTQLVRFDFEDGTLQGWTIISGEAGNLPTGPKEARGNVNFGQQGKYFIGLYENPKHDEAAVVLQSPTFVITSDYITLLVGGGNHPDSCYVALYRASDDKEIARETGRNSELMTRRYWKVSDYKNERMYLRIVDSCTGGWGHLNVDDIRELTPSEIKSLLREQTRKENHYQQWLKSVTAPSRRIVYSGKTATDVNFPLGGIGSGHLSICADGAIRQWCIFNRVNEACVVPDSFFAVWARPKSGTPIAKILQQRPPDGLPGVQSVEFIGEYPIAHLKFVDDYLPVDVRLKAFSPFIPMNAKDSAIPAAVFEFTVRNKLAEPTDVSLLSTLQNAAGYDGLSEIRGVTCKLYGGNTNTSLTERGFAAVLLSNPRLPQEARQYGTMALAAINPKCLIADQWDNLDILWREFSTSGVVTSQGTGPSGRGRTWNTAAVVPLELRPYEEAKITFVWSWHFPNLFNWWDNREGQPKLGRMYANWFTDALDVIRYVAANYDRLSAQTQAFRDTFYKTTLPYWMLDRISAQCSTLVSTVCMWLEDGHFVAFEGAGCCPMNCTHVWNYEQLLAHLFPELERNMRHIDLEIQQNPDGGVRHRTRLPVSLPRETMPFCDGHLGTILKAYREYRLSNSREWFDKMWPRIKLAMQFAFREYDPNKDGVIVATQWNTYDAAMYGPNTFIGSLYLAALRACEEMARIAGDEEFAKECRSIFESGSKRLDEALWTGEYWRQIETKPKPEEVRGKEWLLEDWPEESRDPNVNRPYGKGCHADQLLGQWWANIVGLGYVLPKEHVRTALESIMKYNWVGDFGEVVQQPRAFAGTEDPGLYVCTWPYGGKPEHETLYSFEVWTGIEYEVAGLLLAEGKTQEAYQIVKAVSDRYNGIPRPPIQRNPWAEVECSNHYARAMAAWALLLASQGYAYCGPEASIGFNPVISPDHHASFFSAAEGWGLFTQKRSRRSQQNTLKVEYGKLVIRRLTLNLPESAAQAYSDRSVKLSVKLSGKSAAPELNVIHPPTTKFDGTSAVTILFSEPVTIHAGQELSVRLSW